MAVCISFPLFVYGLRGFWLLLIAGLFCVGFACTDEFHQSFVGGRSPAVRDVCIDTAGALIGSGAVRLVCVLMEKKKRAKQLPGGPGSCTDTYGAQP